MTSYNVNLGEARWSGKTSGLFRPKGAIQKHGTSRDLGAIAWRSKETIAARIFVGFNVGGEPRWTVDNLIKLVLDVRQKQGVNPSATILAQKGIYQHTTGDRQVVIEDGAQVIIFKEEETTDQFVNGVVELAEVIARVFQQESVIVEIQRNGVTQETIGVVP